MSTSLSATFIPTGRAKALGCAISSGGGIGIVGVVRKTSTVSGTAMGTHALGGPSG